MSTIHNENTKTKVFDNRDSINTKGSIFPDPDPITIATKGKYTNDTTA
ncbi:MAG: DUF1743 domain-containing protein [Bacteroidetes bacterium]|nr:DUF1743 domain-containing protein [Bacteroidota bacterium]